MLEQKVQGVPGSSCLLLLTASAQGASLVIGWVEGWRQNQPGGVMNWEDCRHCWHCLSC